MSNISVKDMDSETLKALEGSIAKWEGIVAGVIRDEGTQNCPLCVMFYGDWGCEGCPVRERTGLWCCEATPYVEYAKGTEMGLPEQDLRVLAQKELDFLKSLLPQGYVVVTDTIKQDLEAIRKALELARAWDLQVEVVWSAINYMRRNPDASIESMMDYGINEWIK